MKTILVFAAVEERTKQVLAPYQLPSFLTSLRDQNIEPVVLEIAGGTRERLRADSSRIIHTFGDVALLPPVWRDAAKAGCLVVHSLTTHLDIRPGPRLRKAARGLSPKSWWARHASRHVQAILGSNRASIRDCLEAGLFRHAKFSMITLPPVEVAMDTELRARQATSSLPRFGYRHHEGADRALKLLFDAVKLTADQHLFRLVIGGRAEALASNSHQVANVSFQPIDGPGDFVRSIDVLIVPQSDDRAVEEVVMALRYNKIVVAPDGGSISELLQFGRGGVLFRADSPYDLAMAINNVTGLRARPPFDFTGASSAIDLTAPPQVARIFARAYRKLAYHATPAVRRIVAYPATDR